MLLAVRTGNKAWQEIILPYAAQIRLIKGRIKFVGAKDVAPFDSAVAIFTRKPMHPPFIGYELSYAESLKEPGVTDRVSWEGRGVWRRRSVL